MALLLLLLRRRPDTGMVAVKFDFGVAYGRPDSLCKPAPRFKRGAFVDTPFGLGIVKERRCVTPSWPARSSPMGFLPAWRGKGKASLTVLCCVYKCTKERVGVRGHDGVISPGHRVVISPLLFFLLLPDMGPSVRASGRK